MDDEMLDPSDFADLERCPLSQVVRAQRKGKLPEGKIPRSHVGNGWRRQNKRTLNKSAEQSPVVQRPAPCRTALVVQPDETPEEAAERIVREGGLLELPDALKLKENYLGRLKQLEYDLKAGQVVLAADVARLFGEACAQVRTRLLAIPAEQAPRVHRLRSVVEVQDALQEMITQALEALTADAAGRTG